MIILTNKKKIIIFCNLIEDKSAYKLAESAEIAAHTVYESNVTPLNVIYDSVVNEREASVENRISPKPSDSMPKVADVLVKKYEREIKKSELREEEEREREQREKEIREEIEKKERLQFEQKIREREQREREERNRELREKEMREQREREAREQQERERLQLEQKMREQSEREARERDEFEHRLKQQEEKERLERIDREKELREREEREKKQRDRERELARLEFEKSIREKRDRDEKEQHQASEAQAALAALTTFIIPGNQDSQQSNKKLLQVQDEITTTATTNQIYHIENQECHQLINEVTLEPNNEMITTDYDATYVHEEDTVQYDTSSQISDEEEQRKQIAGNYISSLIDNVRNDLLEDKNKNDDSFVLSSYKAKPLSDDLLHLVDSTSSSYIDESNMYYKQKMYIFEKDKHLSESEFKQPSLAQIIQSLNKGVDLSFSESSEAHSMQESYAPPFSIGIRLRQKANALEIGNHVISYVEPNSLADKANLEANSRLLSINDTPCDDKTHEFVLFFLNYVLRKKSCDKITLCVEHPVRLEQVASRPQINYINESYRIENANLRAIIRNILTGEEFTPVSYTSMHNLEKIVHEAKQQAISDESEYHELETMASKPAAPAVDSSGIENLKSIIRQIKYSFEQHVEADEELETPIHIDTQLKQSDNGLENLKNILQQAIDRNQFYLNNSHVLLLRGIV